MRQVLALHVRARKRLLRFFALVKYFDELIQSPVVEMGLLDSDLFVPTDSILLGVDPHPLEPLRLPSLYLVHIEVLALGLEHARPLVVQRVQCFNELHRHPIFVFVELLAKTLNLVD